mmetsp:Transcript_60906/g.123515  ORF Transcript_60906/g.123515 Transcript_60906/m.123515 type:complete len:106 (+) Transcript_60906:80-397(+)
MSWGPPPPRPTSAARPSSSQAGAGPSRYNTNLQPKQVQYLLEQLRKAREAGVEPTICERCKRKAFYCYYDYYKRGGTKYLYACEHCLHRSSRLEVSEEDYDFLAN